MSRIVGDELIGGLLFRCNVFSAVGCNACRRASSSRKEAGADAEPLEELLATCDDSLVGQRDRALLLFAWASGGRRRSEVTSATVESLQRITGGYVYDLARSQTNQSGDDRAENHKPVHLGCWTHCRRYFHDALQALPKDKRGADQLAARFIDLIGKLYHIEAQARRDEVDVRELGRRRQERSAPVLADIEALLLANLHAVLPKSLLGQALHYLASQWIKLKRYVEDGRYGIDNNVQENAIRPFCVGRRNWLFADTVAGANASANLYSLLQTCPVNGIDGYRYLAALLVALPKAKTVDDYEALLPWRLTPTS